jgi:uncharacterized protein (DUF2141 family)
MLAKRPIPGWPKDKNRMLIKSRAARFLSAALFLFAAPAMAQTATASLTVDVTNVSPKGGNLRLSLYDKANYEKRDGVAVVDMVVPAKPPRTQVVFPPVPPGTYAIKMFQDYNKNEEFDFTWIGLPAESYGFSNNARPGLSEPSFDKTQFTLPAGAKTLTIELR